MTKPTITKQSHTITDDTGFYSGNILIDGAAADADGDIVTVANVDGQFLAGAIGGGKGTNIIVGDYGTMEVFQDGTYTYTLNDGLSLADGESFLESFTVKIRDSAGSYTSTTLKFEILGTTNDSPVAVDDIYSSNSPVVGGNLLANDTDPDGDTLHVGGVIMNGVNYHITGQSNVEIEGVYGTLVISDNGTFTYTVDATDPDTIAAGGSGFTEKFAYKPHDGQNGEGNNTDYAVVEITIL